jgi:hypothetical protein
MRVLVIGLGPYYFLPSAAESGSSRAERLFIQAAAAHFPGETRPGSQFQRVGLGVVGFAPLSQAAKCRKRGEMRMSVCTYTTRFALVAIDPSMSPVLRRYIAL